MLEVNKLLLLFFLILCWRHQCPAQKINDIEFIAEVDSSVQKYIELLPKKFDSLKVYDLAIGLHGHGSDRWQFAVHDRPECSAFRAFAEKYDMLAITPDYRAKTSWMGPQAESDMIQIVRKLKDKYKINRIFLIGGSMGGTSALTFAALYPELISGAVSLNGHVNFLEYDRFQEAISESFGGSKQEIPEEYKRRSAEYWPENIVMPVAFTIGMRDTIIPPVSIIRFANVLNEIGKEVWLDQDESRGHETDFDSALTAMEFIEYKTR